jgi:hypothetical protein
MVPSVVPAVHHALSERSRCVPSGGVMLSVTNKHHARLRALQFALIGHRACFMKRVVSVCFNNVTDAFGVCVRSTFTIPPSDFRRSNYANLIWAKWRIIGDALGVARIALWLDADVIIFRNPWAGLGLLGAKQSTPQYDIRYQSEPPPVAGQSDTCTPPVKLCPGCAGINGGQLLVSNAQVALRMYAARPRNLSNTDRLDQDWADALIHNNSQMAHLLGPDRPRFSSCVLPDTFTAECWKLPNFQRSDAGRRGSQPKPCMVATHHFNCVPSMIVKFRSMRDAVGRWVQRCGNESATSDGWHAANRSLAWHRSQLTRIAAIARTSASNSTAMARSVTVRRSKRTAAQTATAVEANERSYDDRLRDLVGAAMPS